MKKGTNILHYKIFEKLGEGGMGVVYKAHDSNLDRTVALKFLPSHFTEKNESRERFIREAKTAATLNHPNICTIYSIEEYEEQHFISMEYIEGTTLREKLQSGRLELSTVLQYASQVASALSEAHEKGIIHRDIKPENIMVNKHGRVIVTDFGLARVNGDRNLTKDGQIAGTMPYMAPEQMQYGEVDERSDLFSFGIVLYEMLTGLHPFDAEYTQATGFKIVNENPDPPSSIRPGIPPGVEDIVLRCLEKEREKRYQSARDLSTELEGESSWPLKIAADKSKISRGFIPAVTRIKQKPWFWAVTGILVLAIGGWLYTLNAGTELPAEKHIAVLPFDNLSSEMIPASMSDGMMEIVTSKITRMETREGSLWVVPSSEIREEQVSSPSDAVRLFGVNMAVTGSLQRVGDRFRLTINLVDGSTLRNLRSEELEREWAGTDFAQLQDDVVETLTGMLELELGANAYESILAGSSEDPRAYQLYIEGKGALSRFEDPEKIDAAIELFEEAVEHDPGYALAYAGLAEAFWRKFELTRDIQWTEVARRYAGEAMQLSNRLPEVTITLALINNGMRRFEETLEILGSLDEQNSLRYDALIQKADAYQGLGQMDEAEKTYQLAIEQKKNYWGGYHNLGVFYFNNSQYAKAAEQFRQVLELAPDNIRGYNNLGAAYYGIEEYGEAIEAFKQSLSIQPNSRAFSNLGTYYLLQKNYSEAINIYKQAVEHRNTDYRFWGNLGTAYYYSGKDSSVVKQTIARAIELAEQQLEVTPNNADVLGDLAGYYLIMNNNDQARELLRQLTNFEILSPENEAVIGHLYERLGDRDSALQWFEQSLENGFPLTFIENLEEIEGLMEDPRMTDLRKEYAQ